MRLFASLLGLTCLTASIISLRAAEGAGQFIGAPEPAASTKASPLTPAEQQATFTLPPGFEIELVASESEGIGKFVGIDWDTQGRLWSMTALEYPVDANESPEVAKELYASRAKDKVVVWDQPYGAGPRQARVFAEGLAIPLGILPYKNGVYVQHGADIAFLSDTDGDGKADKRDVVLSGFGIQDSHLFPHQFTRAPGNWIWIAQGAFNYGKVRDSKGGEVQFDQTRMARFRYDGTSFDITSQGPCNIWGLVLDGEGESWIQEANDYGYPMMAFNEYANYPGCSDSQFKSYAPEFPSTAPDFRMGGTGLSGLALSDKTAWLAAYADVFYVANPITRKIQAIKVHREGGRFRYEKLPDFVQSSDEWFRPVALRQGPDGCLYFVDWYNKIISHNEVPRNHPERDKVRGRIWRVKHKDQKPFNVPDFTKLSGDELLAKLGSESTLQGHLAWQAITDRQLTDLAPKLKTVLADKGQSPTRRLGALWALEGLQRVDQASLRALFTDSSRNIRREAVRAFGNNPPSVGGASGDWVEGLGTLEKLAEDTEPEVRAEVIRTTARLVSLLTLSSDSATAVLRDQRAYPLLLKLAQPTLAGPTVKSSHNGRTIKVREAYDRDFERYLVRMFLEKQPETLANFLNTETAKRLPLEAQVLATLALEPKVGAERLAKLLPQLARDPSDEEVLRLAQYPDASGAGEALQALLQKSETRGATLQSLLNTRSRLDAAKLTPALNAAALTLWNGDAVSRELAIRLASAFKLAALESELTKVVVKTDAPEPLRLASLKALREIGAGQADMFVPLIKQSTDSAFRTEAVAALAASRSENAPQLLISLWPEFSAAERRPALVALTSSKPAALGLVRAVKAKAIAQEDVDAAAFGRLQVVLGDDAELNALMQEMAAFFRPALRLNGREEAWVETDITLDGPFTVETWVKLDAGLDNNDGLLGAKGALDINFYDSRVRVWVAKDGIDAIVANKKMTSDIWTHIAITRDAVGKFRIYLNGELDQEKSQASPHKFEHCQVAWTGQPQGTAGWLSEYRIWKTARTAQEIRENFDRSLSGDKPEGLVYSGSGNEWGKLQAGAKVEKTADFPLLLTQAEAEALAQKFAAMHALAEKSGDVARGKTLFTSICMTCHRVGGQGGQIGPVLNGAGALGVEALLRNLLTPNAAMEPGYRMYRVELKDGDLLDGLLVSQDAEAILLRRPNSEDLRIPQRDVRRAEHTRLSVMPEGLLEALPPQDVTDLFAYLKTLK